MLLQKKPPTEEYYHCGVTEYLQKQGDLSKFIKELGIVANKTADAVAKSY